MPSLLSWLGFGRKPLPAARRKLGQEAERLHDLIRRLSRVAGTLSFLAGQGGPEVLEAEELESIVECLLHDRLRPALEALEREAAGGERQEDRPPC
jgi:hypothetical protein